MEAAAGATAADKIVKAVDNLMLATDYRRVRIEFQYDRSEAKDFGSSLRYFNRSDGLYRRRLMQRRIGREATG